MTFEIRRKSTLEPRLFLGLTVRMLVYGCLFLGLQAGVASMDAVARWMPTTGVAWQDRVIGHSICSTLAFLLLAPGLYFDARTQLHRITGPMLRLNRAMRRMADGEEVELMRFRKHDYWGESAENWNRLLKRWTEPAHLLPANAKRTSTESTGDIRPESTVNPTSNRPSTSPTSPRA